MSYTLIEVLKFLGIRWSIENNRLDRKSERFRRATEKLEKQSWNQTDPELTQQLQAESEKLYREWDEAEQAFYIPWDHCFSNAAEWCAAHTAIGSDFIRKLAIVGFDASHLMPEQEDLLSALPKLVEKLLGLPRDDWQTTGWAKFVVSLQATSEAVGKDEQSKEHIGEEFADDNARIRGLYEWAMGHVPGAEGMTIPDLLEAIQCHPAMTSDFLEVIPDKPDAFRKSLNRAGIYRYDSSGARKPRQSRRPKNDAT